MAAIRERCGCHRFREIVKSFERVKLENYLAKYRIVQFNRGDQFATSIRACNTL